MPTSATGASEPRRRVSAGRPAGGFSLLELLVVVAIIAVLAGMAVLATGGMGGRRVENAARRAEALIALACERAALTGRDMGVALVADGLRFGYLAPQGFQRVKDDPADPLRPRALGEAVQLALFRDGQALQPVEDPPATPQLACFASGELTPFRLRVAGEGESRAWELHGAADGKLRLEASDDAQ